LNGEGHQEENRSGIWSECASISTFYSNILATRVTESPQKSCILVKKRIELII
jgi:hypothetical protein